MSNLKISLPLSTLARPFSILFNMDCGGLEHYFPFIGLLFSSFSVSDWLPLSYFCSISVFLWWYNFSQDEATTKSGMMVGAPPPRLNELYMMAHLKSKIQPYLEGQWVETWQQAPGLPSCGLIWTSSSVGKICARIIDSSRWASTSLLPAGHLADRFLLGSEL